MRNEHKGFSLIELLIVVAIILIIAAIAVPNFLRSKIAANQSSAVGSLRSLNTACIAYTTTYGQFPAGLTNLGPLGSGGTASSTSADLIDSALAAGIKSGYTFTYTAGTSNQAVGTPFHVPMAEAQVLFDPCDYPYAAKHCTGHFSFSLSDHGNSNLRTRT
jgi:prepilin-type N-terminal cleavage/methylation domain-containing protein